MDPKGHTSPSQLFSNRRRLGLGLSLSRRCTGPSESPPGAALPRAGERNKCSSRRLGTQERSEEAMWPWIRTPGGRGCLLSHPWWSKSAWLVHSLFPVSCPCAHLAEESTRTSHWPQPPRTLPDSPSSACLAPWASVAATVVKWCELTRWCRQAVLFNQWHPIILYNLWP